MTDEHEIPNPFILDHARHVGDVQGKIDSGVAKVPALAKAGQRRREYDVAACPQPVGDASPGPAAVPRAVDEDEGYRRSFLHPVSPVAMAHDPVSSPRKRGSSSLWKKTGCPLSRARTGGWGSACD